MVRADPGDLRTFAERGVGFGSALRAVFDSVAGARSRTLAEVAGPTTPTARVARLDGGHDPLAELIAEAGLLDAFVTEIADALTTDTSTTTVAWRPATVVDVALADAGLGGLGPDRSMTADQDLLAAWSVGRELDDVLAGLDAEVPDHLRAQLVGLALEEWLGSLDGADPDRLAAVAEVLIHEGVARQVDLGDGRGETGVDGPTGAVATMLVTQGVLLWPGDRGELVEQLTADRVTVGGGGTRPAIEVVADALDLDRSNPDLNLAGLGRGEWHRANQPWVRDAALLLLVEATMGADGTISAAGRRLVDDVIDRHPSVVDHADDTWHDLDPSDRYHHTADGRACRVWPTRGLRQTLARALAAPAVGLDVGLTEAEYRAALAIDDLDRRLAESTGSALAFNRLLAERLALVDELVGNGAGAGAGAEGTEPLGGIRLFDEAMARGLSAAEALRLVRNGADPAATDARVRRLRVLYPTTAWGDPVDPDPDGDGSGSGDGRGEAGHGLPLDVARTLAVELAVLQSIQAARYAEGRPRPTSPLSEDQVDLVRRYAEVGTWFHHRFAWGWPGGTEAAAHHLAALDDDEIGRILPDAPDGFGDLLDELVRPGHEIVWDLLAGAAGNDTFLGPDGTFRPAGGDRVGRNDAPALLVQLALLSTVGPHHGELDADGDGIIHEDEVGRWLDAAADRADVPPALVDQIRLGARYGLGQDTFGWEELGELVGWVGLAAAATATIVYSGGAAAPLWVKAGLVGLAAVEVYAAVQADDPWTAGLAAVGGVADLAAAARLLHLSRTTPIDGPVEAVAAQRRREELIELARRADVPALRRLADEAGGLGHTEFLDRYEAILDGNGADLIRRLMDGGATYPEAMGAARHLGIELTSLERFAVRRPEVGSLVDANFAQDNPVDAAKAFSREGRTLFSGLAGRPIRTVQDLVDAIELGHVDVADLAVDYVVLDGHRLILNTRTSTALHLAGIPRSRWAGRDQTGRVAFVDTDTGSEVFYADLARDQLKRNRLPAEGSPILGVER